MPVSTECAAALLSFRYPSQYTIPYTVAIEPALVAFTHTRKHTSMASRAILANAFEEE